MLTQKDHVFYLRKIQIIIFCILVLFSFVVIPVIINLDHLPKNKNPTVLIILSIAFALYIVKEIIEIIKLIKYNTKFITIDNNIISRSTDDIKIELNSKVIARKCFTYVNYKKPMFISKFSLFLFVVCSPLTFPIYVFATLARIFSSILYNKFIANLNNSPFLFDCLLVYDCDKIIPLYLSDINFEHAALDMLKKNSVSIQSPILNCLPKMRCK